MPTPQAVKSVSQRDDRDRRSSEPYKDEISREDRHILTVARKTKSYAPFLHGDLPAPPHGSVNEPAICTRLLMDSGFNAPAPHVQKVRVNLWLRSAADLMDTLQNGTVRLSALIGSQPRERAAAIVTEIEKAAAVTKPTRPDESGGWMMLSDARNEWERTDALSATATLLKKLADVYGVSGHEHNVRAEVIAALPA